MSAFFVGRRYFWRAIGEVTDKLDSGLGPPPAVVPGCYLSE